MIAQKAVRLAPALLAMGVIFWFSSQASSDFPNFGWADYLLKKSGHLIEYAILSAGYWYAFGWKENRRWHAWLLSILYAVTDEFHQSFVPGRFPSIWDVLIFDLAGVLFGLWLANRFVKHKRPNSPKSDRL